MLREPHRKQAGQSLDATSRTRLSAISDWSQLGAVVRRAADLALARHQASIAYRTTDCADDNAANGRPH